MESKTTKLLKLARDLAASIPDFHTIKGAGPGDHATNQFMRHLRKAALTDFGVDNSERAISGTKLSKVDFYFEDEGTIVEIALGLPNPNTEFEKDIFKALLAQDLGHNVQRLVFLSRPGAAAKCAQPARAGVTAWAKKNHGLEVMVHEFEGKPRKRVRKGKKPPPLP